MKDLDIYNQISEEKKEIKKKYKIKKKNKILSLIDKIKVNKACICCCFLFTERKNFENILLDEDMHIITDNLDILNILKKLFKDGKLQ